MNNEIMKVKVKKMTPQNFGLLLKTTLVLSIVLILFPFNIAIFAVDLEADIQTRINQMTLDEKEKMCYGNGSMDGGKCDRLGIGPLRMCDGPLGAKRTSPSTGFGSGLIMAQTWNSDLMYNAGVVLGEETNGGGGDMLLGPGINIERDLVCGRTFEYFTEDPYLNGKLAAKYVQGVQNQGVAATIKHFIANNQENNREGASSNIDERTLREIYLPGYEMAIKEGNAWAVMTGCNLLNGTECAGLPILRNVLKNEYGFQGITLTDWSGIMGHSTESAATAGMDLSMPNASVYSGLAEAVTGGTLSQSTLDDMVRRILRVSYWSGVSGWGPSSSAGSKNTTAHQTVTRQVADEGIVLLKNTGNILPLSMSSIHTVCLTGRNATTEHCGGGGSSATGVPYEINPQEGLQNLGGLTINYQPTQNGAVSAAQSSDVTIVVTGMVHAAPYNGGDTEGSDRPNLDFPAAEISLINAVAAVSNKVIVVVIGGPSELRDWIDNVEAVVYAAYPGMEGGNAIANMLFGNVNPSGKLTVTWPKRDEDQPSFPTRDPYYVNYSEGIFVGYRGYEKNQVLPEFAFGHGLSYTTFQYSNLQLSPATFYSTGAVTVNVDVKNTGARAGKEIVQLYVTDKEASVNRPVKELKGFSKVSLAPNETKTVTFTLDYRSFAFWADFGWYAEPGQFDILVGSASDDIRLTGTVTLQAEPNATPTPTPTPTSGSTPIPGMNLAKNKPVTVSSTQDATVPGLYAVDNNFSTRWGSATGLTNPEWIYIDLQKTYQITGANLSWETAYGSAYQIQVSSDAVNWITIYSTTTGDGGTDDLTGLSGLGRYVRMYGTTKGHPEYGYSLWEFAVFGYEPAQSPYGGNRWVIPGTIEAENYDTGGEGVAYHDTTSGNAGALYRDDGVDIQATTDTGGGYNVCCIISGEWLEYSVSIPTPGTYTMELRVARELAGDSHLHVECDGNDLTGLMTVPSTGQWQTWTTITKTGVYLNTINLVIKICCDEGYFNVNWLRFTMNGGATPTPAPTPTLTPTPTPTPYPVGPSGYTWCASENQTYTLTGTCDVAYGANGSFNYLYGRTGSITFNNATFGDPCPGVVKAGFYKSAGATPTPTPTATPTVIKAWEFASTTESWTAQNQISGFAWQSGGYVGGTVTGSDPYLASGGSLGVAITSAKKVKVRLKNSTGATTGQIYFITNADGAWNEAKHKDFTINANDANYTEYTIDMSTVTGWTGTLKQLRLDPEMGATSGSFSVDYIRISN